MTRIIAVDIPVTELTTGDMLHNGKRAPKSIAWIERNPRGCWGNTHVLPHNADDSPAIVQCYANCSTVTIAVEYEPPNVEEIEIINAVARDMVAYFVLQDILNGVMAAEAQL